MVEAYSSGPIQTGIGAAPWPLPTEPPDGVACEEASVAAILAALDAGDLEQAAALSQQALSSGVTHPAPLCVMAMALEYRGRIGEALPYLERALALLPADVSLMLAHGRCLLGLERPAEALEMVERALEREPLYAEAHAYRGQALERLSRMAEAERSYGEALDLEPGNLVARAGMAAACSHFGAHREARAHALAVLDAAPDDPGAQLVLAAADLAEGSPVTAEARVRELIAAHGPVPALVGHLADALDAQDRTPEAFEAYARSGEALRRQHEGQYASDDVLEAAERTAGVLERLPVGAWPLGHGRRTGPAAVETHVFLLGFARSGTSLLALALQGDPQVEVLDEQEPLVDALRHFAGPDGTERLLAASDAELAGWRAAYWRRAGRMGARLDRRVFVDKQPMNSLHLPLIARLFPEARILVARRDPRDVVLSCFRRRFLMNRYTYHLLTAQGAARLYAAAMRVAEATAAAAPLQTLAVAHERLVEDFDRQMDQVCAFLGVPLSDAVRSFSARVRSRGVATPSAAQLARGLNRDGVGQWRRYERQLEPLAPLLKPWIGRFGYDREGSDEGRHQP
jgi:tetratricopeptide (TPR) repeat protein